MGHSFPPTIRPDIYDVLILGAGISGLNAAYRIQQELPDQRYAILEARDAIGGTWDFFRYPGLRSDSDLFTFGFGWSLWAEPKLIADAGAILHYMQGAALREGIDKKIQLNHKALAMEWSTEKQLWFLTIDVKGEIKHMTARALVVGCGYYDYAKPLAAHIPGLENFQGQTIHPQSWPADLNYAGKNIVIIGSGATAITLLPNLTPTAGHVTMLQRSPSYVTALPNTLAPNWLLNFLPKSIYYRWKRLQMILVPSMVWIYCRWFPKAARKALREGAIKELGEDYPVDVHFNPKYEPWDQRLCLSPDGDFFKAIRSGAASVVTDHIERVTEKSIILKSGQELHPDIIVTATGLKLQIGGGMQITVDGHEIHPGEKILWRQSWMQDVPNCAFVIGYVNESWTLGADTTAILFCRLIKNLRKRGMTSAIPRRGKNIQPMPYLPITSTYVKEGKDFPATGSKGVWKGRSTYYLDLMKAKYGSIDQGIDYYMGSSRVTSAST